MTREQSETFALALTKLSDTPTEHTDTRQKAIFFFFFHAPEWHSTHKQTDYTLDYTLP